MYKLGNYMCIILNNLHCNDDDGAGDYSKQELDGQWLLPSVDTAHTAHAAAVEASANTQHHRHGQNDSSPSSSTLHTCTDGIKFKDQVHNLYTCAEPIVQPWLTQTKGI